MIRRKSVRAGVLALCLIAVAAFCLPVYAEEGEWAEDWQDDYYWEDDYWEEDYWEEDYQEDDYQEDDYQEEDETEAIPESYDYKIESNDIKNWPQGPKIEAASAIVMDLDSNAILYSKQATEKQYPASITKIMTTLLLLENCDDLDQEITFSDVVYDIEPDSTHLSISEGETMTLRDCAYGIMLASANDIANGVAEYIAGSVSAFADMMNEKAEELGCVNTHFSNPHGLYSDDHYTCAYDMALIAQAAFENETFREITGTAEYTIPETNKYEEERFLSNHHQMLHTSSEFYEDWCLGGKNGYTSQCLNTLVTYAEKDGMTLVSVVLRVNGSDKAYAESIELLDYGFENFYAENYEKKETSRTFYDIIGFGYFGKAAAYLSPVWNIEPIKEISGHITLPDSVSEEEMTFTVEEEGESIRNIFYEYNGQPVGAASGEFNTFIMPVQLSFEKEPEFTVTEETTAETEVQIEGLDEVLTQTVHFLDEGYRFVTDFAENHFFIVLVGGAILLIILVILIIVLIFRCTADARIRRRRKLEEKERLKREEEIEQMTTAEIEAELRAAMDQEEQRKEQEKRASEEAERAAREAEEMEEKAHETERLLDELEQERQARASKDEGINN